MIRIADKNAPSDHLIVCTGEAVDPEVGLVFEPTRHFDPTAGRWLSDEPAGFRPVATIVASAIGRNRLQPF